MTEAHHMSSIETSHVTAAVATLGCKVNQYDSMAMESLLRGSDIGIVPFSAHANVYIINTCTVTAKTDCQSRQFVRRARKNNPSAIVIVTGCYAEVSRSKAALTEGVDYVLGNAKKADIIACINMGRQNPPLIMAGENNLGVPFDLRANNFSGETSLRTRAILKIQDGCDRFCSFCIIPRARGAPKSLYPDSVLKEIDSLVERGFKEIILTGIHLGAYGRDLSPPRPTLRVGSPIAGLLKKIILKRYPARFRLSSIDPDEVTDELVRLLKSPSIICNHLHLPLQSGDDKILSLMRRPYGADFFRRLAENLYDSIEGISIGADVIAGFPGEGDKEFENTYHLLKDLPMAYLHVFPYSKREGTLAAGLPLHVKAAVIKERSIALRELDKIKRKEFHKKFIGKILSIVVESSRDKKTGLLRARASNYIPVFIEGGDGLKGGVIEARVTEITEGGVLGKL